MEIHVTAQLYGDTNVHQHEVKFVQKTTAITYLGNFASPSEGFLDFDPIFRQRFEHPSPDDEPIFAIVPIFGHEKLEHYGVIGSSERYTNNSGHPSLTPFVINDGDTIQFTPASGSSYTMEVTLVVNPQNVTPDTYLTHVAALRSMLPIGPYAQAYDIKELRRARSGQARNRVHCSPKDWTILATAAWDPANSIAYAASVVSKLWYLNADLFTAATRLFLLSVTNNGEYPLNSEYVMDVTERYLHEGLLSIDALCFGACVGQLFIEKYKFDTQRYSDALIKHHSHFMKVKCDREMTPETRNLYAIADIYALVDTCMLLRHHSDGSRSALPADITHTTDPNALHPMDVIQLDLACLLEAIDRFSAPTSSVSTLEPMEQVEQPPKEAPSDPTPKPIVRKVTKKKTQPQPPTIIH